MNKKIKKQENDDVTDVLIRLLGINNFDVLLKLARSINKEYAMLNNCDAESSHKLYWMWHEVVVLKQQLFVKLLKRMLDEE